MRSDHDLLQAVAVARDAEAFAQIVTRYLGLIYGSARRQVGAAMADDVTQAVFLLLWQRASYVRSGATLAGWLMNATRLAALQVRRGECRRRRREETAATIRSLMTGDAVNAASDDIAPLLDQALEHLAASERSVIALRYLQDKSLAEIAVITGISEAAAAKRISRGLDRLRRKFSKHGLVMTSAAIGLALEQQGRCSTPPSALGAQVIGNAAIGNHAMSAAIVKGMVVTMTMQKVAAVAVGVLILLLISGGAWFAFHGGSTVSNSVQSDQAARAIGGTTGPKANPIEVGVVVSAHFASTRSYNYTVQTRVAPDLQSPDIELFPIIEAGSEEAPGIADEIARFFPGRPIITDAQPDALRKLNVIVANEVWQSTDGMLKALDGAVSDGVSFLNNGGIGGTNSSDPASARLAGLLDVYFGQTDDPVECVTLADHPILGRLRGLPDLRLRPNGVFGKLPPDAVPLIKVVDMKLVRSAKDNDPAYNFYPLYVSKLGRGKIIGCTFAPYKGVPEVLDFEGRSQFFIRCVRWLADRPVE